MPRPNVRLRSVDATRQRARGAEEAPRVDRSRSRSRTGSSRGTLRKFFEEKGFGFLRPEGGGNDVFVHVRDNPALRGCQWGDPVTYDVEYDD